MLTDLFHDRRERATRGAPRNKYGSPRVLLENNRITIKNSLSSENSRCAFALQKYEWTLERIIAQANEAHTFPAVERSAADALNHCCRSRWEPHAEQRSILLWQNRYGCARINDERKSDPCAGCRFDIYRRNRNDVHATVAAERNCVRKDNTAISGRHTPCARSPALRRCAVHSLTRAGTSIALSAKLRSQWRRLLQLDFDRLPLAARRIVSRQW